MHAGEVAVDVTKEKKAQAFGKLAIKSYEAEEDGRLLILKKKKKKKMPTEHPIV